MVSSQEPKFSDHTLIHDKMSVKIKLCHNEPLRNLWKTPKNKSNGKLIQEDNKNVPSAIIETIINVHILNCQTLSLFETLSLTAENPIGNNSSRD